ncbi:hypothetical protein KQX54_011597 [Cotesia glomerata]|uniref:Uncharacterized protein n=1 Tax=Cotesia glomerata TaxID=32391 RepID=A0AAV7J4L9_COTGL|nr:hypothetical protein KQX54_011597 [Cotesia glomerata]
MRELFSLWMEIYKSFFADAVVKSKSTVLNYYSVVGAINPRNILKMMSLMLPGNSELQNQLLQTSPWWKLTLAG